MIVARSMHERWLSNAFVLGDEPGGTAVFVDSGAPLGPLLEVVERERLTPTHLLRTHAHPDHVEHEDELCERFGIPVVTGDLVTGGLDVRAIALPGHSDDGVAFVVNDEICFSGDVLFKDAVGGGPADVVRHSVMEGLMTLPPEIRVLPGPHRRDDDRARVGAQPVRHLLARRGARRSARPCRVSATRPSSSSGRPTTTATARRSCASPTAARRSSAARASSAADGAHVRLIVARCEVTYSGRLNAVLPEAVRLLMLKSDGSFLVHADTGGFKPQNWMTPPTVIEHEGEPLERIVVRKRAGKTEDRLDIRIVEILSDADHDMGEAAALAKDGVERDLQEELAARPEALGEELRLVRREWPTDIGPVDLMCRDTGRRLGRGRDQADRHDRRGRAADALPGADPARAGDGRRARRPRGAEGVKQARTLAEARGLRWVEVDLAVLRGEREPELTLFG